jgi:hypothetical protein
MKEKACPLDHTSAARHRAAVWAIHSDSVKLSQSLGMFTEKRSIVGNKRLPYAGFFTQFGEE